MILKSHQGVAARARGGVVAWRCSIRKMGWGRPACARGRQVHQLFGNELNKNIEELNGALAA